jgi:hypothetical protein
VKILVASRVESREETVFLTTKRREGREGRGEQLIKISYCCGLSSPEGSWRRQKGGKSREERTRDSGRT